ncbi:MAG: DUF2474 domain-containing protein [Geminicoccaceae bacterium]
MAARVRKLVWFAALYVAGIAALGLIALGIRSMIM